MLPMVERRITKRFRVASARYQLIADGDRILVGLSGGKDSLCLLELLARQSRILRPHFQVEAVHIRVQSVQYEADTSYLDAFCKRLEVPLHLITTSIASPDDERKEGTKPICFLCSWNRRKQLFDFAQRFGFNKIALGHHQDDLLHTALLNLTFQGHFSTMPVRLKMQKMPLEIIRPLCMVTEEDIRVYAADRGYLPLKKQCPHERDSHRADMAEYFERLQQLNPEARYSLWHALEAEGKLVEA
ncbi:MAG: tRNA 2-thiocytidine biosynthesis TtcA family protein [Bacteroidales bacterium]|nr:tRNA 2-thiocytidine biosynthesis TtcA family protein [Bacteroidales bacterium]